MANWLERLVSGVQARVEHTVEAITGLFRGKPDDSGTREVPDKQETSEAPRQVYDPDEFDAFEPETGVPEEFPDDEETADEEEFFDEVGQFDIIEESKDTRGPFLTQAEAEAYASEIPVPTTVGKTPYGLWIVRVDYP